MFSYNGSVACHVHSQAAMGHDKHYSRDSNQILLNDKRPRVLTVQCAPKAKSAT